MLETNFNTFSTRFSPLWLLLLSIPISSCASQGKTPILAGETRLAGGSSGGGYAGEGGDNPEDLHIFEMDFDLEGGSMITDQFEIGLEVDMFIGLGEGEDQSGQETSEFFSLSLDPGVYGRLYFTELGTGVTPWISANIVAEELVNIGLADFGQDVAFVSNLSLGLSMFLADHLALELELEIAEFDFESDDDKFSSFIDSERLVFSMGLAFYY